MLKDVITCQSDYLVFDDCSENPCEDIQKYVFELGKMVGRGLCGYLFIFAFVFSEQDPIWVLFHRQYLL